MKRTATLAAAALLATALVSPADAATGLTARSSSATAIWSGPGTQDGNRYRVIGHLQKSEIVRLERCTRHSYWCLVIRADGGPDGWVDGLYLIGSAAKTAATPSEFMIHFGLLDHYPEP